MHKSFVFVAAAAACAGFAGADVITFENDAPGLHSNAFSSADSSVVMFTDTWGTDLVINNFYNQGFGQALAVFYDDTSGLMMTFAGLQTSLSLWFGNDDPGASVPGDLAVLTLYNGGIGVGQVTMELNRNDNMDQMISASSAVGFDWATFYYTNADRAPIDLIEIVDNITFSSDPIPAPGAAALIGLGGLAAARRRR